MASQRVSWRKWVVLALLTVGPGCSSFTERRSLSAGSRLYNAGKYEEAVAEYERVLAIDPSHWDANYMVASSHLQLYRPGSTQPKDIEHAEAALVALERCLKLQAPDPVEHQKVENFYAALLTSLERTDKAIEYFEGLLAKNPTDPEMLGRIGELYHRKGDFPRALEYFQRRAQAAPQDKQGWYVLGVMCWERSHNSGPMISSTQRLETVRTGMEALTRAVEVDPGYREALVYLNLLSREEAQALADQGDTTSASAAMNRAMEYERRALALPAAPAGASKG